MQASWEKLPRFLRNEFPLSRTGLSCVIGGEAAFAMQIPEPKQKPPVLIFARLSGGGGALARMVVWLASQKKTKREAHDLGGGLIAIASNGAEPEGHPAPADPVPFPEDALGEIVLRPEAVLKIMPLHIQSMPPPPPLQEIVGVHLPPKDLRLLVRAPGDGSLTLEGAWVGELPPVVDPAPLFDAGQHGAQTPVLEAELPFNMRAAFLNWLDREVQPSKNGSNKELRKWENRLLALDNAGVDLNRDLWPAFGPRLKLAVVPPDEENGEKIAKLVLALPFNATDPARRALAELGRVRWDGLAENREKAEEDWKIYLRRFTQGETQRFVLVKKSPPIPLWMIAGKSFAAISDSGPLAPMWGAPDLVLEKPDAAATTNRPVFFLRVDGKRLAPQAAIFAQSTMEDERDDDKEGAAKFMEKYPDEQLYLRLTEKLARFAGDVHFEMRAAEGAESKTRAVIKGRWLPGMPTEPEAGK
ncbi:MAG: hypothetical protein HY291_00875 [Planctomycetes bacterium]|nr:hypothetical protein [Planctomycetota bacterium]